MVQAQQVSFWVWLPAGLVELSGPQCMLVDITGVSQSGLRTSNEKLLSSSMRKSVFLILPMKEESNWMQTHYISEVLWKFLCDSIMMNISGCSHARKCLRPLVLWGELRALGGGAEFPADCTLALELPGLGLNLVLLLISYMNFG